jgi:hypothetical protein
MRLLGWSEEACRAAAEYVHKVRRVYTGEAWSYFSYEVEQFLDSDFPRSGQTLVARFPRRYGIDRNLNITI